MENETEDNEQNVSSISDNNSNSSDDSLYTESDRSAYEASYYNDPDQQYEAEKLFDSIEEAEFDLLKYTKQNPYLHYNNRDFREFISEASCEMDFFNETIKENIRKHFAPEAKESLAEQGNEDMRDTKGYADFPSVVQEFLYEADQDSEVEESVLIQHKNNLYIANNANCQEQINISIQQIEDRLTEEKDEEDELEQEGLVEMIWEQVNFILSNDIIMKISTDIKLPKDFISELRGYAVEISDVSDLIGFIQASKEKLEEFDLLDLEGIHELLEKPIETYETQVENSDAELLAVKPLIQKLNLLLNCPMEDENEEEEEQQQESTEEKQAETHFEIDTTNSHSNNENNNKSSNRINSKEVHRKQKKRRTHSNRLLSALPLIDADEFEAFKVLIQQDFNFVSQFTKFPVGILLLRDSDLFENSCYFPTELLNIITEYWLGKDLSIVEIPYLGQEEVLELSYSRPEDEEALEDYERRRIKYQRHQTYFPHQRLDKEDFIIYQPRWKASSQYEQQIHPNLSLRYNIVIASKALQHKLKKFCRQLRPESVLAQLLQCLLEDIAVFVEQNKTENPISSNTLKPALFSMVQMFRNDQVYTEEAFEALTIAANEFLVDYFSNSWIDANKYKRRKLDLENLMYGAVEVEEKSSNSQYWDRSNSNPTNGYHINDSDHSEPNTDVDGLSRDTSNQIRGQTNPS
jgi:hypothetical protein